MEDAGYKYTCIICVSDAPSTYDPCRFFILYPGVFVTLNSQPCTFPDYTFMVRNCNSFLLPSPSWWASQQHGFFLVPTEMISSPWIFFGHDCLSLQSLWFPGHLPCEQFVRRVRLSRIEVYRSPCSSDRPPSSLVEEHFVGSDKTLLGDGGHVSDWATRLRQCSSGFLYLNSSGLGLHFYDLDMTTVELEGVRWG
jgi:hypothetical protein